MSTARFRRVANVWNWLPAFRCVAEHQSIHRAAAALAVSPSALSRTVKQIEDVLGSPLFVRRSTGLVLTSFGADLVGATRDAMRVLDDCIDRLGRSPDGSIGLTACASSELLLAALSYALPVPTPKQLVKLQTVDIDDVHENLLSGQADLAVVDMPVDDDALACEAIGELRLGLYASRSHHLAGRAGRLERRDYDALELAAAPGQSFESGAVVAVAEAPGLVRMLCLRRGLVGILPDIVAVGDDELVRLGDGPPAMALHTVTRRPVGHDSAIHGAVQELRDRLRRCLSSTVDE